MNVDEFLVQAGGHGHCVGVHEGVLSPLITWAGVELRTVEGADTKTRESLFHAFAQAWHFPPSFAQTSNADAFNDWMRDLDNLTNLDLTKPPAPGYFTRLTNAHLLLAEQPEAFTWFANSIPFYRDYYRDELSPPAAFGVLLSAPADELHEICERWLSVGVQVAKVTS